MYFLIIVHDGGKETKKALDKAIFDCFQYGFKVEKNQPTDEKSIRWGIRDAITKALEEWVNTCFSEDFSSLEGIVIEDKETRFWVASYSN